MVTREKAIGNVLRDYSRARDKGTRASTIERVLRMREENARERILSVLFDPALTHEEQADEILGLLRGRP